MLKSSHQQNYIYGKIARKPIKLKKMEKLIYKAKRDFYTLKTSHCIFKVVTTCFGVYYSNLNDFTALLHFAEHGVQKIEDDPGDLLICS